MISFLTLLLGLVTGSGEVSLSVSGPVAAIVVELDGAVAGRVEGPPWTLTVDFGAALVPHDLVARAFNSEGREIGRARQLINVPRPAAEVHILLERDGKGHAVSARLTGESLLGPRIKKIDVTFDGKRLAVDSASHVKLPPYDRKTVHVLTAEAEFSSPGGMYTVSSRADAVVGGGAEGSVETELTPVPVRFRSGTPARSREQLQGLFRKNGEPLGIAAVEHHPAELWIVRDAGSEEASRKLAGGADGEALLNGASSPSRLEKGDRLQFVWPSAKEYGGSRLSSELFELSSAQEGGLYRTLTTVAHPSGSVPGQRFSDAVAVAALQALQNCTRRAVLLVLGSEASDGSRFSPLQVRQYLREVRVPLFVWTLGKSSSGVPAEGWGETEDVSNPASFAEAVRKLRDDLASQSIVWVAGRHLPRDITLTPEAGDLSIVE